jgi:hypothetical protein
MKVRDLPATKELPGFRVEGAVVEADSHRGSQRKTRRPPSVSEDSVAGSSHRDYGAVNQSWAKEQK